MEINAGNLREYLFSIAKKQYQEYIDQGIGNRVSIGVTIPELRAIAKTIARSDWRRFINEIKAEFYEERLIYGMVIGYAKAEVDEIIFHLEKFIPYINSWAVCDSVVNTLKIIKKNKSKFWEYIQKYIRSDNEYEIRFAIVIILWYFLDDQYIDDVFIILDSINHQGYYVKMAVAWAISFCFIKYPEKTLVYLKNNSLDDFTYNKAIQKTIESFRVKDEHKNLIKLMKRKK